MALDGEKLRAQQSALAELELLAIRGGDIGDLFNEACRIVATALGTDLAKILTPQRSGALLIRAGVGWPEGIVGVAELPAGEDSQAAFAFRTREPVVVTDLLNERRFEPAPLFLELGIRSGVNVVVEGRAAAPIGVLEVDDRSPRQYSPDEVAFLQAVANVLSGAVERREADSERDDFYDVAAHELGNPMVSVLGFSSMLRRKLSEGSTVDREDAEALNLLYLGALRVKRTLERLFALGRVDRTTTLESQTLDLAQLVRDVVSDLRPHYPKITFEEHYPAGKALVSAEPTFAQLALTNIIENAAKYSNVEPRVAVSIERDEGGRALVVDVADNCGGINAEDLDRIFDRYYRGQSNQSGLGIGLYIVERATETLGWEVSVYNAGMGCTFRLRIPTAQEVRSTETSAAPSTPDARGSSPTSNGGGGAGVIGVETPSSTRHD
jgi:signal transduction histidine kinase